VALALALLALAGMPTGGRAAAAAAPGTTGRTGESSVSPTPDIQVMSVISGTYDGDGFNQPLGMAVDSLHREIYVANSGQGRIDVYTYEGRLEARIPHMVPGANGGLVPGVPVAVALDRRGRLFVVDQRDTLVDVLDFRGRSIGRLALTLGDGRLAGGCAVAASPDGRVFVGATGDSGRIFAFSDGLKPLGSWGVAGNAEGQLSHITSIASTPDGDVVVARILHEPLIQLFTEDGRYLRAFGYIAGGNGSLAYPAGVVVTSDRRIWVCDQIRHNVQVYDSAGTPLITIGSGGNRPGELYYPCALATDGGGTLVVSERAGARLQVWNVNWKN
jgi:DNA-binding beta-propeller fold protein YncE